MLARATSPPLLAFLFTGVEAPTAESVAASCCKRFDKRGNRCLAVDLLDTGGGTEGPPAGNSVGAHEELYCQYIESTQHDFSKTV